VRATRRSTPLDEFVKQALDLWKMLP
jgi:hypothetical protein